MNTNNDYLTLYLESLGDIISSNKIELISSTESVTQENLNSIWLSLGYHLIYERSLIITDKDTSYYVYEILLISEDNPIKFNNIIYLNELNEPVGCTKLNKTYSSKLGDYSYALNIILNISIINTDPIEKLMNIDLTIDSINTKKELGESEYNYSITSSVLNKLENLDNYIRYTNNTSDLLDSTMSLLTDSGIINNNQFYRFNLFSKFKSLIDDCNIFEFSYYQGKPVMFICNSQIGQYELVDLLNVNAFGKPRTVIGYIDSDYTNFDSLYPNYYFAQNYLVLNLNKLIELEFPETGSNSNSNILEFEGNILVDSLDIENKRPGILSVEAIDHSHEIYTLTNEYYFYRLVGDWSVYLGKSLKTPEYWISSFGSFLGTVKEKTKLLSNRVFLSQENEFLDTSDEFKFTTVYCVFPQTTLRSNSYNERSYVLLSSIPDCPRRVYSGANSTVKYYGKYMFTYNNLLGLKNNQFLDGFRKLPITNYNIPQIIGTLSGIIFYKDEDNYINYL